MCGALLWQIEHAMIQGHVHLHMEASASYGTLSLVHDPAAVAARMLTWQRVFADARLPVSCFWIGLRLNMGGVRCRVACGVADVASLFHNRCSTSEMGLRMGLNCH